MNSQTALEVISGLPSRTSKGLKKSRSGVEKSEESSSAHAGDAFCVDRNLRFWASSRIIARGVECYRKRKVISVRSSNQTALYLDFSEGESVPELSVAGPKGHRITAEVRGSSGEPYSVEIDFDHRGVPLCRCGCPYTWEPLCKHAVAALLAWQQQETGSESILDQADLRDAALDTPQSRERYIRDLSIIEKELRYAAAVEQELRILRKPKHPLGNYVVSSANPNRGKAEYQVTVRDGEWRHASCACVDFRTNELGTCKHVEFVRKFLCNKSRARELERETLRGNRIWIYPGSRQSHNRTYSLLEEVRFYIPPKLKSRAPAWLTEHLDSEGYIAEAQDPSRQQAYFHRMLQRLKFEGWKVETDPQIEADFSAQQESLAWERRIGDISERHPAWKSSIGRMKLDLHPYQKEGILFAVKKRRAFIADDMGLGKTMQAISASLLLQELGVVNRVVVITPASLKFQWKREIEKVSDATVEIIAGSARDRDERYRKSRAFFLILNYELLYRDLPNLLALNPDFVILDEAQRIKNWETRIAQVIKQFRSPFRLALTGTPMENRLPELLSIAEFINPRALGAPWKLVPTYARLNEEGRIVGYAGLDELRRRLSRFLIRRTRQEVLSQLPKRTDNYFWTPIAPEQAEVHAELAKRARRLFRKLEIFKKLTREDVKALLMVMNSMRIVSNAYGQYDWKHIELEVLTARRLTPALKEKIGSPKLEEFYKVMSELLENPGQKVVVFSQWERMLRLAELFIRDLLEERGASSVIFSGALSQKKKAQEVERFLKDPAARVFFSTDAGGVGLNLQEGANCVVNLDVPWNPAVLEQRIGRVHRMGQKKSVEAIHFVSTECIEASIFQLVGQKKALFSGIFSEDAKEIKFTAQQTANFVEKMKQIIPDGAVDESEACGRPGAAASQDPGENIDLPAETAVSEASTAGQVPADSQIGAASSDAVPAVANDSLGPGVEIDLSRVLKALPKILPAEASTAAFSGAVKLRLSRNQEGVQLSLPSEAFDILKSLAPLAQVLLQLASEPQRTN